MGFYVFFLFWHYCFDLILILLFWMILTLLFLFNTGYRGNPRYTWLKKAATLCYLSRDRFSRFSQEINSPSCCFDLILIQLFEWFKHYQIWLLVSFNFDIMIRNDFWCYRMFLFLLLTKKESWGKSVPPLIVLFKLWYNCFKGNT